MNQENLLISFRMLNYLFLVLFMKYVGNIYFLFFSLTQEENCNLEDKS